MTEYQVLARKYRPQLFRDVIGQESIITTLKNAIKSHRTAHAYIFSGSRGTGKTSIARILAKALNCQNPSEDLEPCNLCPSCKEITSGNSLEVIEIDGASNRGIDDIRQINNTIGYATGSGKYKIYIIDEVHMLTKEAFNALLKTLEEPPPAVKFFFATTEPHKLPATIISRCQRYHLNRIPLDDISTTLRYIANDSNITIDDDAINIIAKMSDGGLRDAESILDQVIAFGEGSITKDTVSELLGLMPRDILFELDRAGADEDISIAFKITNRIFSQGKNITQFVEELIDHFRNIMLIKVSDTSSATLLSDSDRKLYKTSSKLYGMSQCMDLLEFLTDFQNKLKTMASKRVALEVALMHIIRSHRKISIEELVKRLSELEKSIPVVTTTTAVTTDATPRHQPPKPKNNTVSLSDQQKKQSNYDTIVQFAAAELDGSIKKNKAITSKE